MTRFFYDCVFMIIFFLAFSFLFAAVCQASGMSHNALDEVTPAADPGPSRFLRAVVSVRFPDCLKGRDPQSCKVLSSEHGGSNDDLHLSRFVLQKQ